jgi:hypothetical protein
MLSGGILRGGPAPLTLASPGSIGEKGPKTEPFWFFADSVASQGGLCCGTGPDPHGCQPPCCRKLALR